MKFQIINRRDAHAEGRKRFYTGKPCKYGHDAQRFVTTGGCVACNAARSQNFRNKAGFGGELFGYRLHPDDHAAALAYCQALDMGRGRVPQAPRGKVSAVPRGAEPVAMPAHIEQRRRELAEHLAAQRTVPAYVPKP